VVVRLKRNTKKPLVVHPLKCRSEIVSFSSFVGNDSDRMNIRLRNISENLTSFDLLTGRIWRSKVNRREVQGECGW